MHFYRSYKLVMAPIQRTRDAARGGVLSDRHRKRGEANHHLTRSKCINIKYDYMMMWRLGGDMLKRHSLPCWGRGGKTCRPLASRGLWTVPYLIFFFLLLLFGDYWFLSYLIYSTWNTIPTKIKILNLIEFYINIVQSTSHPFRP